MRAFLSPHSPHLSSLWYAAYLRNWKAAFNHSKRMASSPCYVWFVTHLMSALMELPFIRSISYFLAAQSALQLSRHHEANPGSPTSQPMQGDAGTRRRSHGADTVTQPKEHMKHPTAQTQAPETSCTLTPWFRPVRCLQADSSSGALLCQRQQSNLLKRQRVKSAAWGRAEQ